MQKLEKPYRGSINLTSGVYFPRTSREAFGHDLKFEKQNHEWMWLVGSVVLVVVVVTSVLVELS